MVDMNIVQAGQLVAAIYKQVTGQTAPAPLDLGSYISVATTALQTGWDRVMNAVSQLMYDTIFAVRPYTGSFTDMAFDANAWGNATRKISYASRVPSNNGAYEYPAAYDASVTANPTGDGESVDMYQINKDKVVQTAFYGESTYEYHRTRFLRQLETAFTGPEQLASYNAAAVQALNNDREGWAESMRRGLLINGIASLASTTFLERRVVHLVTEYNAATGSEFTLTDIRQPANYAPFMRWVYGRMGEIRDQMRELNTMYTTQLSQLTNAGYAILRHTPNEKMRIKITSAELHHLRASVLSTTYNAEYLSLDGVESVPYWQSPGTPDTITAKPTYNDRTGNEHTPNEAVTIEGIFGVMYDADWIGCANVRSSNYVTPFNPKGEYWNDFYKEVWRTRFDMTEKAVLLLLD